MNRPSYPASLPHPSWPVDRECPLHIRFLGWDICVVNLERKRLRILHLGCPPACAHREKALQILEGDWDHVT